MSKYEGAEQKSSIARAIYRFSVKMCGSSVIAINYSYAHQVLPAWRHLSHREWYSATKATPVSGETPPVQHCHLPSSTLPKLQHFFTRSSLPHDREWVGCRSSSSFYQRGRGGLIHCLHCAKSFRQSHPRLLWLWSATCKLSVAQDSQHGCWVVPATPGPPLREDLPQPRSWTTTSS